jgi:hypothetical protein
MSRRRSYGARLRGLERTITAFLPTTASTSACGACLVRAAASKWRRC